MCVAMHDCNVDNFLEFDTPSSKLDTSMCVLTFDHLRKHRKLQLNGQDHMMRILRCVCVAMHFYVFDDFFQFDIPSSKKPKLAVRGSLFPCVCFKVLQKAPKTQIMGIGCFSWLCCPGK